jgi:hypothetical protein
VSFRSFINRALGRKPKWQAPTCNGLEHDDWRIGDLAQCTMRGEWHRLIDGQPVDGPRFGQVLRVSAVGMFNGWHGLEFEAFGGTWVAEAFLKIRPQQREACTPEFACMIKSIDRRVEA